MGGVKAEPVLERMSKRAQAPDGGRGRRRVLSNLENFK